MSMVVQDLQAGLALWNRNGYYSTLVTPEGEVIDPMGIVTGGSGARWKEAFSRPAPAHQETVGRLTELESQLHSRRTELNKVKQELEQAETKKTLLASEIHRLELERVRLEHEHLAANKDRAA